MTSPRNQSLNAPAPQTYFAALDGLRGIMALLVALFHVPWLNFVTNRVFSDNVYVILDLFFVFSGFLMFTLYAEKLRSGRYSPSRFLVRRVARLYPLHLFLLLCFAGWMLIRTFLHTFGIANGTTPYLFAAGSPESFWKFLTELFLLNSVGLASELSFNAASWTVGAEFFCYILFAVTVPVIGRYMATRAGVAVMLLLILGTYGFLSTQFGSMNITFDAGFLRCFAGFYLGVLIAICRRKGVLKITRHKTLIEIGTLFVCLSFVVLMTGPQQFLVAPFLFLFVIVFMQDGGAVSKLLARKPNLYLARVSYSVYLNHMLIAIFCDLAIRFVIATFFPGWVPTMTVGTILLVPYVAIVLIASELTFRFIEVPGAKFMNAALSRFIRDPQPRAVDGRSTAS